MSSRITVKISIITVAFNAAGTLKDTLRSVAAQTHAGIEHILVDGRSNDATLEIARTQGAHLAKVISEPDRGIYDAMNKGLRQASGDIICFLNADDMYADEQVLERVAKCFREENLDGVLGDIAFFKPEAPDRMVRRYDAGKFNPSRIAWGWMPAHPAMFLRRAVYERVGPFKADYRIAGDFEFVARAFRDGKLRYRHLPEVLVKMRTGGISTGGWRNTLLLNKEVMRACRENGIYTNFLMLMSKYPAKLMEFVRRQG